MHIYNIEVSAGDMTSLEQVILLAFVDSFLCLHPRTKVLGSGPSDVGFVPHAESI